MKGWLKAVFAFIYIAVAILSFIVGENIPMKEQVHIYDGLRNTAAIIFGIMGAWIAMLYPNKLNAIFKSKDLDKSAKEISEIKLLFKPMIYSTLILFVVISVSILVPVGRNLEFLVGYKGVLRSASFSLVCTITVLQFWSLLMTLLPGDFLKRDIDAKESKNKTIQAVKPTRRRQKSNPVD
ncbi:hypothetical protein [Marinimicrobium agarilyticum]|uniref:hypothetical protein n=1 Tax=Marinimicrobium agarilyticum TaxID=306546 RepID=UPI000484D59C|nr:hypothetical protein [Marinimicrobium agarilyticum]